MNSQIQYALFRKLIIPFCLFVCLSVISMGIKAQEQPPKPIKVTVDLLRNLNFGTFCFSNSSGKVIIDPNGVRSSLGDIILINSNTSAALFYVEAIPGTQITISNGPDAILSGSNGGTMLLQIGDSNPRSPFTSTGTNAISIGGILNVGTKFANPPGDYSGTFSVTFVQE
jgi:hypothetical protein